MQWIAWSMLGVIFLLVMAIVVMPTQRARRRRKIVDDVILQLKGAKVKFYKKNVNGVIGVTRADSHRQGERTHHFLVENGKLEGWDKVVIYAIPTYTFAVDEQTRRPIHTGVVNDLWKIADDLVYEVTRQNLFQFTSKERQRIVDAIVITDNRLYVPYSGKDEDGKRDFEKYGKTTLGEARRSLAL